MGEADDVPTGGSLADLETSRSGLWEWFLVGGNRIVVTGVVLSAVFLLLVGASVVWPFEMLDLLTETRTAETLFNTLLSGTILLVSVVVSINSAALSRDLSSLGAHRERVHEAVDFRETVEDVFGVDVSPTDPSAFIRTMIDGLIELAESLEEQLDELSDDEARQDLEAFAAIVRDNTRYVESRLESADPGSVDVLSAGLAYDYANEIRAARQLRHVHRDELTEDQLDSLEDLVDALEHFAVAHEYFKSIFYTREFAKLSKTLLYVALPVIVFISYVLMAISAGQFVEFEVWIFSGAMLSMLAAYSIALAPYVVLTTFVLRSATVATRSLAAGTFSVGQS